MSMMRFMVSLLELNSRIDRVGLVWNLSEKSGSKLPCPAILEKAGLAPGQQSGKQIGDGPERRDYPEVRDRVSWEGTGK
jgi:hypothetical protein